MQIIIGCMLYTNVCNVPYQLYLFVIRRVFSYPFHCGAEQNSKAYLTLHQQPLSRTSPPGHYKANLPSLLPAQQINHQQSVTLTLIPLGSLKLKLVTPRVLPSSSQVPPQGPSQLLPGPSPGSSLSSSPGPSPGSSSAPPRSLPRFLPRLFLELLPRSLPRVLLSSSPGPSPGSSPGSSLGSSLSSSPGSSSAPWLLNAHSSVHDAAKTY